MTRQRLFSVIAAYLPLLVVSLCNQVQCMTYLAEKATPGPWYLEYYAKALVPFEAISDVYFMPALSIARWLNEHDFGPNVVVNIPEWPARFLWASLVALLLVMTDHSFSKYRK